MICQICKDNTATLRFTEMKNNKSTELHVCQSCAEAKGISVQVGSSKAWHHEMFAKLVDDVAASDDTRVGPVQCEECGMKFSTFRETSRFGCASCYRSFAVKVIPILRRIHGNTRHVGKNPTSDEKSVALTRQVRRLEDQLQRAIAGEDFEKAADLRDQIKELQEVRQGSGNRDPKGA